MKGMAKTEERGLVALASCQCSRRSDASADGLHWQDANATESDDRPWFVTLAARFPWWVVSALFHLLVIAFIGMVTFAIERHSVEACTLTSTDLQERSSGIDLPTDRVLMDVLDTPPTDPAAKEPSDIKIPPDILAAVSLGDHFETVNPDGISERSAYGDTDGMLFHSVHGDIELASGGGLASSDFTGYAIGPGGAGPGDGGGWGGGFGTGTGVDNGSGHGAFGQRRGAGRVLAIKGHGAVPADIQQSYIWLAAQQEPDGHWDAVKHGAEFKTDTAVTALALLAFLGAGHSEKVGTYKLNVQRAAAWLAAHQNDEGRIFDASDAGSYRGGGYPHAIATLALCECHGMTGSRSTKKDAAQKAVDYCVKTQHPTGGWRYRPGDTPDLSVTGWHIMALKSAKVAGLHVDSNAFTQLIAFLDSVEIKGDAQTSFTPASRYNYQPGYRNPPAEYRLAAIGNLSRLFLGYHCEDLLSSIDGFIERGGLPKWGEDGQSADLYYWYYATLCALQVGGDTWTVWDKALVRVLSGHQCRTGAEAGSWPVAGAYSREWGRVGQTAFAILCLELWPRHSLLKPK